jgi:hypothetical protein
MKNQLPYCNTSEAIKGYSESDIAKQEMNDCVVRAIASAFDFEYDKAHKFVAEKFRIGRKCIKPLGKKPEYSSFYSLSYDVIFKGKKVKRDMTVSKFISKYPTGIYIITVRNHAFTIKNGVVIGNKEDSMKKRRKVIFAWKVGN